MAWNAQQQQQQPTQRKRPKRIEMEMMKIMEIKRGKVEMLVLNRVMRVPIVDAYRQHLLFYLLQMIPLLT